MDNIITLCDFKDSNMKIQQVVYIYPLKLLIGHECRLTDVIGMRGMRILQISTQVCDFSHLTSMQIANHLTAHTMKFNFVNTYN